MPSPLELVFTADTSGISTGVTRGMEEAARAAQSGSAAVAASFQGIGRGVEQAAKGVQAFAREQGQQARVITRLRSEIQGIIPMSREAAEATGAWGGALYEMASGPMVSFGAGLAVLGAAVATYKLLTADAEAQIKQLSQAEEAAGQVAAKAADELVRRKILAGQIGRGIDPKDAEAALKWSETIGAASKAAAGFKDEADAAQKKLVGLREMFGGSWNPIDRLVLRLSGAKEEADAAAKKFEEARATLEALQKQAAYEKKLADFKGMGQFDFHGYRNGPVITPGEVEAADKAAAAQLKEAARRQVPVDDAARRSWSLSQYGGYGSDTDQARIRAERQAAERSDLEANLNKYAGGISDRGMKGAATSAGMSETGVNKYLDNHAKKVKETQAAYKKLQEIGTQALSDLVSGHKSVGDVVKDLGRQALQMAAKWAFGKIMNYAAEAFGATFASSSEAGPPGVIAAPGLAASAFAAVAAMASNLISAEGGGDFSNVPLGKPFQMVGHGGEIMIPAPIASYVRKAAERDAQGRGGDTRVSTTLRVVGRAGTFYDMAVEGGRDLARAMLTLRRQGVL